MLLIILELHWDIEFHAVHSLYAGRIPRPWPEMFPSKKFVNSQESKRHDHSLYGRYLSRMRKNSFIYFGIPFFAMMLAGTYFMTQFASVRYEQFDRRQTEVTQEQALQINGKKRKVDMREEFYRLQHMDLDNWEQKRVQRLPGESDNKW